MFHFSLFLSLLDVSERDTALKGVCKLPKPYLQNYRYQLVTLVQGSSRPSRITPFLIYPEMPWDSSYLTVTI